MIGHPGWIKAYRNRGAGPMPHTQSACYSLGDLAARGGLDRGEVNRMLLDTGLRDFTWYVAWADDQVTPDDELVERIVNADGYVVFIHGWTGSNMIWESLPVMIASANRRLIALVVDHNGFGETPFVKSMPDFDQCNPVAAMRAIERWFNLLRLRRQPGDPSPKVVNFVGHSMGGAALFYLDEAGWKYGEQTRTAIAPALLLHDELHRTFYTTLGLGIGLVGRLQFLETIDHIVAPRILETLTDGATDSVRNEHTRIYAETPKAVTARTFAAMGVLQIHPDPHDWKLMHVVLAHRDLLVGLVPMLDLLDELNFNVDQVRVVLGTHYLFSVGSSMERIHAQNRQLVLADVLNLHEQALQRQRSG